MTRRDRAWRSFGRAIDNSISVIDIDGAAFFTDGTIRRVGTQRLARRDSVRHYHTASDGTRVFIVDGFQPAILVNQN